MKRAMRVEPSEQAGKGSAIHTGFRIILSHQHRKAQEIATSKTGSSRHIKSLSVSGAER